MSRLSPRNRSSSSRSSVMTLIKSSSSRFTGASMRIGRVRIRADSQAFLHDGTGGRVLQELALAGKQVMLNTECRQCSLVKAAQDELLFARISVDVADRENSGHAGLEIFRVDLEGFFLEFQAPVGDGAEFWMQPVERHDVVGRNLERGMSVVGFDHRAAELVMLAVQRQDLSLDELHLARRDQLAHPRDGGGRSAEFGAPMHQREGS